MLTKKWDELTDREKKYRLAGVITGGGLTAGLTARNVINAVKNRPQSAIAFSAPVLAGAGAVLGLSTLSKIHDSIERRKANR